MLARRRDGPQGIQNARQPQRYARVRAPAQPIWADLEAALVEHGVRSYSLYLDAETNDLFAYVCRRWWRHMRELMPSNADDSPVSRTLDEVFHIERQKSN